MKNSCLNCKFAEWKMTNHNPPRINNKLHGNCTFKTDINTVKIPPANFWVIKELERTSSSQFAIWANDPHTNCSCWESKN
jgi:hypothetical protein